MERHLKITRVLVCSFLAAVTLTLPVIAQDTDSNDTEAIIVNLPGVDFAQGDLRAIKTKGASDEESIKECRSVCEADKKCNAFTLALHSHKLKVKRGWCWLKSEKFKYVRSAGYMSGIRR